MARFRGAITENFSIIPNVLIRNEELSPGEFRVLCYVASYNKCHPSQEKMAKECGMSLGPLKRYLKSLIEKGLIVSKRRYNETSLYTIPHKSQWKIKGTSRRKRE